MCLMHRPGSIFCVLPPYVLDQIAHNGTPQQRSAALKTKSADNTFRAQRLAMRSSRYAPQRNAVPGVAQVMEKRRTISKASNSTNLPGALVRSEGQGPSGDPAVDEAYDGLGATYDFYAQIFDRNSIDDSGCALGATVHFGEKYNNAFWNSERMVFGDGDGELFNRFTISLDVIGHELTHGVIEDESQLQYFQQSGALNESLADVFGSLIKQFAGNQTADQADWLIGKGLFTSAVNGLALRSMKEPGSAFEDAVLGKDPQPGHMSRFVHTFDDNGGVHINSGIPNRAFYLVATKLGGYAWQQAGRIWYDALRDSKLKPNASFRRFARLTEDAAVRQSGANSTQHKAVREAWAEVGIEI